MKITKIFYIGFAFLLVAMGVILFTLQEDPDDDSPPSLKLGSALYKGLARSAYYELNNNNYEELKSKFEEDNEEATNLNAGAQYLHLNDNTFSTLDLNPAQGLPLEKLFDCISQEAGGAIFAQYKESKWQLYPALTEDEGVETISDAGTYKIYPGEGFILILKSQADAYCLKTSDIPSDAGTPTLFTGWNLIGVNEENLAAALPDREDIAAVWYLDDFEDNLEFLKASKEEFADITLDHYLVWVKILSEGQVRTLNLEKLRAAKMNAFCSAYPLGLLESDGTFKQNEAAFDLVKSSFVEQNLDLDDVSNFQALEEYVSNFNFSWADFYDREYVNQIRECAPELVDFLYPEFANDEYKQKFVDTYVAGYCQAFEDGYFDKNSPEFIARMTTELQTNGFEVANSRQELDKFLDRFELIYNNGNWRDKVNEGIATCVEPQQENIVDTYVEAYCEAYSEGFFDEESASFKNKITTVFNRNGFNVAQGNLDAVVSQIDDYFRINDLEEAAIKTEVENRINQCKEDSPIQEKFKGAFISVGCAAEINNNFALLDFDENPELQAEVLAFLQSVDVDVENMDDVKALQESIFRDDEEAEDTFAFIIDEIDRCHPGYKNFLNGEAASIRVIITFIPGTQEAEKSVYGALGTLTNLNDSQTSDCIATLPCTVNANSERNANRLLAAILKAGGQAHLAGQEQEDLPVNEDEILVSVLMTSYDDAREPTLIRAIRALTHLSEDEIVNLLNSPLPITILSDVLIGQGERAQRVLENLGAQITLILPEDAEAEPQPAPAPAPAPAPQPDGNTRGSPGAWY